MISFLRKLLTRIEDVSIYFAVISSSGMMCLTTADAMGRYLFNRPILGAYEFTEKYLMVVTVFMGVLYAYHGGVFIRVTFLVDRLPLKVKTSVNYFVQSFSFLLALIFVVATTKQAFQVIADRTTLNVLPLPLSPAYFLVPVGLFFLSLLMVLDLRRIRAGKSDLFKEESPDS